jgi:hypothetical protein
MVSPFLRLPLRSYPEAQRDGVIAKLEWEKGCLRQLRLDDPKRGKHAMNIVALEAELDGLNDLLAT